MPLSIYPENTQHVGLIFFNPLSYKRATGKYMINRCWNCFRKTVQVRSVATGKVYCSSCGASMDGLGAVTDLRLISTEPIPQEGEGEADFDH
jgi:ribosomal protein S27E